MSTGRASPDLGNGAFAHSFDMAELLPRSDLLVIAVNDVCNLLEGATLEAITWAHAGEKLQQQVWDLLPGACMVLMMMLQQMRSWCLVAWHLSLSRSE